jgi:hypothetical protein
LLAIHACAVPKRSPASWLLQGATPAKVVVALRADFCRRSLLGRAGISRPVADLPRTCSELREPLRHHTVVGASLLAIHASAVPKRSPASWLLQGTTPAKVVVALRADFCSRSLLGRAGISRPVADLPRTCSELREPLRHHAFVGASLLAIHASAVPKRSPASWLLQGATPAKVVVTLLGAFRRERYRLK